MNLDRFLGLSILLGILVVTLMFVLSPQPQFDPAGFYKPVVEVKKMDAPVPNDLTFITPEDISLTKEDFGEVDEIPSLKEKFDVEYFNGLLYQVGAFAKYERASNLVDQFKLKGFPAQINSINELHYVLVGPFLNKYDLDNNKDVVHTIAGISKGKEVIWKP